MSLTVIAATAESSAVSQSAKQPTPLIRAETPSKRSIHFNVTRQVSFLFTIHHFSVLKENLEGGMYDCVDFIDTSSAV